MAKRPAGVDMGKESDLGPEEVAERIRRIPSDEHLGPGDRIGAERELAERFGVSRWVIRKALQQLEEEGTILRTTNGRSGGVFVPPGVVHRDTSSLVGLPQYLTAQGMHAGTTVIGTRMTPADGESAAALELAAGSVVYQIDRLRFAEELPLSVETVWLPAETFPGLLNHSLTGSVYELLENVYSIRRGEALETITARPATREQASALQVPVGAPLLVVDRTARLDSGHVFERTLEFFRGDRIDIVVHTTGKLTATRRVT